MSHITIETPAQQHPCAYCASSMKIGEPAWQCDECAAVHHIDCWVEGEGCAVYGCANGRSARPEIADPKKNEKSEPKAAAPTPPTTSAQSSSSPNGRSIWIAIAVLIGVLVGIAVVGLIVSSGDTASDETAATAEPADAADTGETQTDTEPSTSGDDLRLTAESDGFSSQSLSTHPGTIKVTVSVPKDADSPHGVGIDGGEYDDIAGAKVGPGRRTSLTVAVSRGVYTIYDPVGDNRYDGFEATLVVK